MKKVLLGLLVAFVLLVGLLVVRAGTMESQQVNPPAIEKIKLDEDALAERLAAAIRFPTVSHEDPKDDEREPWDGLHTHLAETYPKLWAAAQIERVTDHGLLVTWAGKDASLAPVVLCAHLDVVPADPNRWTHPPFAGVVKDGYIWGRGALDDKGPAISILEAAEHLLGEGWTPQRTVVFAFGQDEEVGGARGAVKMAEMLKARLGDKRAHFVVDEGLAVTYGVVPGIDPPVGFIGLAEKGYVTLELTVEGSGGHSSMPPKETAVGILANAIARVEANPMPSSLDGLPRRTFETLGPELPFSQRIVMANLWLLSPVLKMVLEGGNAPRAIIRTTTAPTMLKGSAKDNVLAQEARGVVNFRIKPGDTIESVEAHVRAAVDDERVKIVRRGGELGTNPSPVSPGEGPGYDDLAHAIREVYPDAVVAPQLVLGATDGRHYTRISDRVYRFTPLQLTSELIKGIHGIDERVKVSNFAEMVRFYRRLMQRAAGQG
jgi:carboxypeptidase PM20D1